MNVVRYFACHSDKVMYCPIGKVKEVSDLG
jgi:hypothetical protein